MKLPRSSQPRSSPSCSGVGTVPAGSRSRELMARARLAWMAGVSSATNWTSARTRRTLSVSSAMARDPGRRPISAATQVSDVHPGGSWAVPGAAVPGGAGRYSARRSGLRGPVPYFHQPISPGIPPHQKIGMHQQPDGLVLAGQLRSERMDQVRYGVGNHQQDAGVAFVQDVDGRRACRTAVRQFRMVPGPLLQVFGTVALEVLRRSVLVVRREELFIEAGENAAGRMPPVYRFA